MKERSRQSRDAAESFDQELRRWGRRPPALPPEAAAVRLRARLRREMADGRHSGSRRWLVPAAAALLALTVIGLRFELVGRLAGDRTSLDRGRTEIARSATDSGSVLATAWEASPVSQGVVVIPLDGDTILYLSLGALPHGGSGAENL